jgi:hypothetical protein
MAHYAFPVTEYHSDTSSVDGFEEDLTWRGHLDVRTSQRARLHFGAFETEDLSTVDSKHS